MSSAVVVWEILNHYYRQAAWVTTSETRVAGYLQSWMMLYVIDPTRDTTERILPRHRDGRLGRSARDPLTSGVRGRRAPRKAGATAGRTNEPR